MAESKKFYSAKEAAIAVLAKAEQMLKASSFAKFEAENPAKENEIGTKFKKGEAPPGEIHPKEHQEGEAMHPGARTETQPAPGNNPKEQSEGNNADWGTSPQVKGHIKLAHFMGHAGAKKVKQPNNNTGTAMGQPAAEGSAAAQPPVKKGIALS